MTSWNENIKQYKSKYLAIIVIMILLMILFIGCDSEEQVNNLESDLNIDYVEDSEENTSIETTITLDNDFYDAIENNPIDQNMKWEDSGSENRIKFARDYCDAWEVEIENTLIDLQNYLTEEDYLSMQLAYEGWKQYMQNTTLVEQGLFYIGSTYQRADNNITTGDNDTYPRVMEIAATRTRNYAIELMSLKYALTGKVEFLYTVPPLTSYNSINSSTDDNIISITLLDKSSLKINKSRLNNNIYGVNRLDNKWTFIEIDTILNSIKGSWETDEYIGFVDSSIYFPDLYDLNDNLEANIKDDLLNEYQLKIEHAKSNIPNLSFSVRLYDGKDTDSNYIYVNKNYPSPISIILSEDRIYDNSPIFVDQTTISSDFYVEYPVIYIKFFIKSNINNNLEIYEPATLVITSDNKFYILIDGAFYSLKNIS